MLVAISLRGHPGVITTSVGRSTSTQAIRVLEKFLRTITEEFMKVSNKSYYKKCY
ncbi:MAG: hypothetical protein HZC02_01395 [Candidatus Levybacteria bacterium]|nr:hypothetical protein [Candidatus Levybacteria bacterium]